MSVQQLVVLGGEPEFANPRHVGTPNLPDRDRLLQRLGELLDRRWLTNFGPLVGEFEAALQGVLGVRNVIATCNGTVALEIVSRALGMAGEVVMPSWTFVATAHALRWQEIRPIFADVRAADHTIDVASARSMVTPLTGGIVGVHLWGQPCATADLEAVGASIGVPVVFDAAHAFACGYPDGSMIGSRGNAEVLSFHATKFLNTFEGGAIVTNDDDLAQRCRQMCNFGFAGRDRVDDLGINAKMSEVGAAMGLTSLEQINEVIDHNAANLEVYASLLDGIPGLRLLRPPSGVAHNHQYVVAEVSESVAGLSRDDLVATLDAERVLARRYFTPGTHRMEPYRSEQPHAGLLLGVTERLAQETVVLPTGNAVTAEDAERIGTLVAHAFADAVSVRAALQQHGLTPRPDSPGPEEEPRRRAGGPAVRLPARPEPR